MSVIAPSLFLAGTLPSEPTGSRLPPRYSSLAGTISPSAAALFGSVVSETTTSAIGDDSDIAFTAMRPPRYSGVFQRESRREQAQHHRSRTHRHDTDQDAGSSSVHEYHIKSGGKAQPWATLKVFSRQPSSTSTSSQKTPRFTTRDLVQGSLDLNLESPQSINSISLFLRGRIITSSFEGGSYTFLEQPIITWNRANGDPRAVSPSTSSSSLARTRSLHTRTSSEKFDGKLSGSYSWPFSFRFPTEISLGDSSAESKTYPLPQTFVERSANVNVQYELVVKMTHGILRADSKLHANIVYVPDVTPPPSSVLRQLAYTEGVRIPGPDIDPFGWNTLPPVVIRGKLFNERNVKLQCSLSLASPGSYTRNTIIPLHLSIQSSDAQALDLLATPNSIAVRLTRRVQHYKDASQAQSAVSNGTEGLLESITVVEKAVWWVPANASAKSDAQQGKTRHLEGEIHLEKDLQPSSHFLLFKVSYAVELLPFYCSVFKCSNSTLAAATGALSPILLSHPVTIATLFGEGPTPIAVTERQPRRERATRTLEEVGDSEYAFGTSTRMMLSLGS